VGTLSTRVYIDMIFSVEVMDKSTLFAMLHPIVGDDVCMIRVAENKKPKSVVTFI
jgi:hypothetical protein